MGIYPCFLRLIGLSSGQMVSRAGKHPGAYAHAAGALQLAPAGTSRGPGCRTADASDGPRRMPSAEALRRLAP
eukprot:8118-Prorocentrum_minimum.AAC.1